MTLQSAKNSRRHVAIVTRYPPLGMTHAGRGIASYSRLLAHGLGAAGWDVTVLADRRDGEPSTYEDGMVVVRRVWPTGLAAPGAIVAAAKACQPSVIHVQHELFVFGRRLGAIAAPIALRRLRLLAPVVTTIHGVIRVSDFSEAFASGYIGPIPRRVVRACYGQIMRSIARLSTAVVVTSDEVGKSLISYHRPEHLITIPHGVSDSAIALSREEGLKQLGMTDKLRAVFLGFLLPYKGIETLEAAAPLLALEGIEVVIAGGASGDDLPTHFISQVHNADQVVRLGFVPEKMLPALFAVTDVLVLPYTVGLSASGPLMLAAGFGVPVVVSDVPTLSTLVSCPEATFHAGDAGALAATVLRILRDPVARARILARLTQMRRENTWSSVGERFAGCYEDAIARRT